MWADEAGLTAAQRRIDEWESALTERAERSRLLRARLSGLTARSISPDRTVEATVDSAGRLVALRLDEQTRTQPARRTAEQVLATTRAAYAELLRRVTEATRDTLGPDDPATDAIIDGYARRLSGLDEGAPGAGG